MGLTVSSYIFCNTVGFPTNKEGKPEIKIEKIKIDGNKVANKYPDIGVNLLKPTIDRIKFGFYLDEAFLAKFDPAEDLEDYKKKIQSDLFSSAKAHVDSLYEIEGANFMQQPYSSYNTSLHFKPKGAEHPILIQVSPKWHKHAFIRIDMKVNRLDKSAIKAFRTLIEELLLLPGEKSPSYGDFLRASKITHMELNVDILGARPYDMEVTGLTDNKAKPVKSHVYVGKTGRAETIYPKHKAGKSSTEYVYDKKRERLDAGKQPIYGDVLHGRVECRLEGQAFDALEKGKNRFGRLAIRALDRKKFSDLDYPQKLFVRLALEQSVDRALKLIPDDLKPQFRKTYNDVMVDIWDAKKLWGYWLETVKTSPFLSLD